MAYFEHVRNGEPVAQTTRLTVIAQGPSILTDHRILTAQVAVPARGVGTGAEGDALSCR
jgi:hypothetical protein